MTEYEIFAAAVKITDHVTRLAYVEQQCLGNSALVASVLALLDANDRKCEFLNSSPSANMLSQSEEAPFAEAIPRSEGGPVASTEINCEPDSRVINGRYKLIEEIGKGGMGTVFMAEDLTFHRGNDERTRKYNRYVAVKLTKPSMSGESVLQRFRAEMQALAMMDHPNLRGSWMPATPAKTASTSSWNSLKASRLRSIVISTSCRWKTD
jgi:hypothetical protein